MRPPSDIEFYVGAVYIVATVVFGVIAFCQGFIQMDTSNPQFLVFRKSSAGRLFMAMLSVMFLAIIGLFARGPFRPGDREVFWWVGAPMYGSGFYLMAYLAGPQDVRIDLTTRTCCVTNGWFFRPRQETYPLTEASYLSAHSGSNACFALLRIGDAADHRCILAVRGNKLAAYDFAQTLAEKLQLPVKDGKTSP